MLVLTLSYELAVVAIAASGLRVEECAPKPNYYLRTQVT